MHRKSVQNQLLWSVRKLPEVSLLQEVWQAGIDGLPSSRNTSHKAY